MANGVFTHEVESRRESILDILRDISPNASNYLMSRLGDSSASNVEHGWDVHHVERSDAESFAAEGVDWTDEDNTTPTRSFNHLAITNSRARVTGTMQAVTTDTKDKPMAFQKAQALRRLKSKMEWNLVNGTAKTSGASGTARKLAGLMGVISSHVTARLSGTSMSVDELEDILEDIWTNVDDNYVADVILCPMGIKQKISSFTTRVTTNQDSKTGIFNNVSFFESNSGTVKIVPHKDVKRSAGSVHVFAIREDMFKVAYLRKPFWEDIPKTGDAEKGWYLAEYTLESHAEKASAKRTGYNVNG